MTDLDRYAAEEAISTSVKDMQSGSRVTSEWKGFDNKMGTTLASAHVLCLDLLSHVWLRISGGQNCCQEFRRGMV